MLCGLVIVQWWVDCFVDWKHQARLIGYLDPWVLVTSFDFHFLG